MSTATITTWLLTYLAHSTILLGVAWLIARFMGDRRLALQEVLLRTALVGGLLTATLQVGLGFEPVGGSLAVKDLSPVEAAAPIENSAASITTGETTFSPISAGPRQPLGIWPIALLSLWGIGSILALSVLGRSIVDLRRLLKTRCFRPTGRLLDRLAFAMGLRKPVRLSTSAAIPVPFATGIRQPEICCPERVGDLALEHKKSLFAHELAHLARRDPAWQLLYRLGEAILFLQPLNRLVRKRLEEIAEHLTDERAVACTGDRLGLARCLVVVAHWGISDAPGVPATAFAAGPRLDRRVRHLISGAAGQHRIARWTAPLLAALVVGSAALLPAIAPSAVHADVSRTGSDAVPEQTWSTFADDPDTKPPTAPAAPAFPDSSEVPLPVPPVTDAAPAPHVLALSPTVPRTVSAPAPVVEPAPANAPDSNAEPKPPSPPAAPAPPSEPDTTEPVESGKRERGEKRDEARDRQSEAQRELSEAEREAREQMRAFAKQARELAREAAGRSRLTDTERERLTDELREQSRLAAERLRLTEEQREEMRRRIAELHARSRELAREAAERPRLTDADREKIWDETRELRRQAEAEAREHSRLAAERMRFTEAEREEMRRRVAELHAESREQAREAAREARKQICESAEQARRLAEQAEAERQREKQQRRHDRNED
jgi:beta-lactamase regulating signal transducer with metallopeptidase domain